MSKKDKRQIEIIARGVCIRDGRLLACHTKGAANTYLPGGHVEFGESAAHALARELEEELGLTCPVSAYMGAVEHTFVQKGVEHCEINLVFVFELPEQPSHEAPQSREEYIEFMWLNLDTLVDSNLEPSPLRELISAPEGTDAGTWWGSTYPDAG